jgi:WD40 repeat protein
MVEVPLADRLVGVIADLGMSAAERYLYGSGCIVRGGLVLTAAHVVANAVSVTVWDIDKRPYSAVIDPRFVGDEHGPGPDLALLQIDDPKFRLDMPPIRLARVDREIPVDQERPDNDPVIRCHALGYPWFAEDPSPTGMRDTVDAIGVIPVMSGLATGLLSLVVSISPPPLPPTEQELGRSEWSGISGAPVISAGYLLGVVTEHAPRQGSSVITAVPLSMLEPDPRHPKWGAGVANAGEWWQRLGVSGLAALGALPEREQRPEPAYRATMREMGRTLHLRMPQLFGREKELAQLAEFATGTTGYQWITAGAYAGKTALAYEAATVGLPDEVDVACYFLSQRSSDASSSRFLAAVVPQLAFLCGLDPPAASQEEMRDLFHSLWERAAARAADTGRHLLLVVDGLDEDIHPAGSPSVAFLLPLLAGDHAHVLVTSRRHPELPADVPAEHPLRTAPRIELQPFSGASELADAARIEIYNLVHGPDASLAGNILGLLTAAAGPLSAFDLAALLPPQPAVSAEDVRRFLEERAARSLEPVGPEDHRRYQFAHYSLLEYARADAGLGGSGPVDRIWQWASQWRDAGWPTPPGEPGTTPRYFLDTYASVLADHPHRLAGLVGDPGWVAAALPVAGVDAVLADLDAAKSAGAAAEVLFRVVRGQAADFRPPQPVDHPSYVLRQLCLQAAELGQDAVAEDLRERLRALPGPGLVPLWTTRRTSRALIGELGHHVGPVTALAVLPLPDGRVVSGGAFDGKLLIWDPAALGADSVELGSQQGWVAALTALPDGRVVSGSGFPRESLTLPDGAVVRSDSDFGSNSAFEGRVRVWNPAAPGTDPVELGGHLGKVLALAVLPDGLVVSGSDMLQGTFRQPDGMEVTGGWYEGGIRVWNPATPGAGPVVSLGQSGYQDSGSVAALAVLSNGRVIAGGRVLRVWDPADPAAEPVRVHDRGGERALAVLPDGRVISGDGDGRLRVWQSDSTEPLELGRAGGEVSALAMLPDGRVASGGYDGRVRVWNPAAPGAQPVEIGRHDTWVQAVAVLPSGLVVSAGVDGRIRVWDPVAPATGQPDRAELDSAALLLPDGRVLYGPDVRVWDAAAPGASPVDVGDNLHDGRVAAVLPGGRVVFGSGPSVILWQLAAARAEPVEIGRHDGLVTALAARPNGQVISGGDDGRVRLWQLDLAGKPRSPLARLRTSLGRSSAMPKAGPPVEVGRHDGAVVAVAVTPDGKVLSGGYGDGRLQLWDPVASDPSPVQIGRYDNFVSAVAVLPDGRIIAAGDPDGRLLVWDLASGAAPVEIGRHGSEVLVLAVLPDGLLVSGGFRQLCVWNIADPAEISRAACSVNAIGIAATSPGGQRLLTAHEGQGITMWSLHG